MVHQYGALPAIRPLPACNERLIGCDDIAQLEQNANFAHSFEPVTMEEQKKLIHDASPLARQFMYYKP